MPSVRTVLAGIPATFGTVVSAHGQLLLGPSAAGCCLDFHVFNRHASQRQQDSRCSRPAAEYHDCLQFLAKRAAYIKSLQGFSLTELGTKKWQGAWPFFVNMQRLSWILYPEHLEWHKDHSAAYGTQAGLPATIQDLQLKFWGNPSSAGIALKCLEPHGYGSALSGLQLKICKEHLGNSGTLHLSTQRPLGALKRLVVWRHSLTGYLAAHSLTHLDLHMPRDLQWRVFAEVKALEVVRVDNLADDGDEDPPAWMIDFDGCSADCLSNITSLDMASHAIQDAGAFQGLNYRLADSVIVTVTSPHDSDFSIGCLSHDESKNCDADRLGCFSTTVSGGQFMFSWKRSLLA